MSVLQCATELMKNQKAARTVSNQYQFVALQASDGSALFFGIGQMPGAPPIPAMTAGGLLEAGGWRSAEEIASMSPDDIRNTLITELQEHSTLDLPTLHAMTDSELLGKAAIVVALRLGAVRTDDELKTMVADDQRNTLIAALITGSRTSADLQPLSDTDLATAAMTTWFGPRLYLTPEQPNTATGWARST